MLLININTHGFCNAGAFSQKDAACVIFVCCFLRGVFFWGGGIEIMVVEVVLWEGFFFISLSSFYVNSNYLIDYETDVCTQQPEGVK